jgi:hypothetical protein
MPSNYRGIPANVTYTASSNVSAAVSALAGAAIQITANGHGMTTNDVADITGIQGTVEANGQWTITRVDANTFTIPKAFSNAYTTGGKVQPLAYATSYAAYSDGDQMSAANTAAAATYPSADRESELLISTGEYKLAQVYLDQFFNNDSTAAAFDTQWSTSLSVASTGWLQFPGPALVTGAASGAGALAWPWGSGATATPINVQPLDLVEIDFRCGSVAWSYSGGGAQLLSLALYVSNQAPGVAVNPVRIQSNQTYDNALAGASQQFPVSLSGNYLVPTIAGPLSVSVWAMGGVAGSAGLFGDYEFRAKVWRPTNVPQ